jgi:type I restriction enzyme, S subunit
MAGDEEMKRKKFDIVPLGALLEDTPRNGYSPVCPESPTGKWVLGLSALDGRGLDLSEPKPAPANDPLVDKFMLRPGDFLISRSNTFDKVGRVGVFRGGLENCSYPDLMMRFRPDCRKVNPLYLETYLKSDAAIKFIRQHATGTSGSMKKINQSTVESIPVVVPSVSEQASIATVLWGWYEAIYKAEQLIAAKERHYSHELSRLISRSQHSHGNIGFAEEVSVRNRGGKWRTVALSDIATVWKGKQLNKDARVEDGAYYALNGGIKPSGRTTEWNCEADTITVSEGGNSCGFVSYNRERFWCGGHCYAFTKLAKDVDAHYLFHYLKGKQSRVMALRVGSGLPNIQKSDIEAFPVVLPDLATQTAIARYLNALREEIDLLGQSVAALKTQKRGLMQKLLTGQWRLPVQEEAN